VCGLRSRNVFANGGADWCTVDGKSDARSVRGANITDFSSYECSHHRGALGSAFCGTDLGTDCRSNTAAHARAYSGPHGRPLECTNFGSYTIAILRRLHRSGSPTRLQKLCSNHRVQPF
jgi:hypothetical protein